MNALRWLSFGQSIALLALSACHTATSPKRDPSIQAGRAVFIRHCASCHSLGCNRVGPALGGIVGRHAGAVADFNGYTVEMRYSGIVWTPDRLDALMREPAAVVHLSWMEAIDPIESARERAGVIEFLRSADRSADRCDAPARATPRPAV